MIVRRTWITLYGISAIFVYKPWDGCVEEAYSVEKALVWNLDLLSTD